MASTVRPQSGRSETILKFAIGAACAGIPATQVQAAVDEMIVTSTKREQNLQEIPIAVTAFDTEDIVHQGFKTFSDYVGQIPSLSVVERQPGATNVLMRGCEHRACRFPIARRHRFTSTSSRLRQQVLIPIHDWWT
jgi:outer membrane receptor protein involved in Fe transport